MHRKPRAFIIPITGVPYDPKYRYRYRHLLSCSPFLALYVCTALYLRVLFCLSLSFVLFNDTWSQFRHLLSYMTISLLWLQITRIDIRPHVTWPGDCRWPVYLPQEFVWVCMGCRTHLLTLRGGVVMYEYSLRSFNGHFPYVEFFGVS